LTGILHLIGNIAVLIAFISAVTFCALYAAIAPWRTSAEGWHLMTFTGVIGVAFGWIAYRQVIQATPPAGLSIEIPRAVILSALAALLVWRLALLLRAQTRRRKRAAAPRERGPR
jgi:hypothetical protein